MPKKSKKYTSSGIRIDKSLNKYRDMPIFQKKLDEANKTLAEVGIPDEWKDQYPTKKAE